VRSVRIVRSRLYVAMVLALAGCEVRPSEEITARKPYADFIGAKYRVVGDGLYAYGVYDMHDDRRRIEYVELVPLGIGGREFAFKRPILKGQTISILSAWTEPILFENRVYYLVAIGNSDFPPVFQLNWLCLAATRAPARISTRPSTKGSPKGTEPGTQSRPARGLTRQG
jgi:hypothetical protein